ncbi:MAG: SgcJ/EcaC family oxidoreductase [Clostridia bacterium]|nr:SgcJ/EcaC family oxidoreductase [Clostridia bacterium]
MDFIKKDIDRGNAIWIKAFENQDADLLADTFHTNGAVLGVNGKVIEGREAVRKHFKEWMAQIGKAYFTIETIDVYHVGDDVFEKGSYTLTIENGNQYEGKYIVEWKLEGNKYLFYRDIGI